MTREQMAKIIADAFQAQDGDVEVTRYVDVVGDLTTGTTLDGNFDLTKIADHVLAAMEQEKCGAPSL